jgi:2'-5' RNA ligase
VRLFVALNFPTALRRAIFDAIAPLRAAAPGLAWAAEPRLHLTLKFLGERPDDAVAPVARALDRVGEAHAPVTMSLGGLGAFPNQRRPRVVWLGIAPDPKLELLHHDVEAACASLGYEVEGRAFRPHVTLARVRPGRQRGVGELEAATARALAGAAREVQFRGSAVVETLDLMQSELGAGGSRYTVLHAAPLRPR